MVRQGDTFAGAAVDTDTAAAESGAARPHAATDVALLIDGDNISPCHAPAILDLARAQGNLRIARAYGRAEQLKGWARPGLRRILDDAAKGRTDLLLAMEAVELALARGLRRFVIASGDGDFAQVALFLRELGCHVTGIGTASAPEGFRAACHSFVEVAPDPPPAASPAPAPAPTIPAPTRPPTQADAQAASQDFDGWIVSTLRANSKRLKLTSLNALHHKAGRTPIAATPHKTWRAYLTSRPDLYALDPRGPEATVRLR